MHPRTGLPLHYSHEESILNTLKFVRKDGREVFGMPIPDVLLTDEITSAPYYNRYLEHVAEYQRWKWKSEDLTDSKTESDEEVSPVINVGTQDEGQAGPNPGDQDKGHAGPNPGIQDEGQAGSNPGDAAVFPNLQLKSCCSCWTKP
ncbi:hypothetical protein Tco_0373747 [Tanacetum coccineum]